MNCLPKRIAKLHIIDQRLIRQCLQKGDEICFFFFAKIVAQGITVAVTQSRGKAGVILDTSALMFDHFGKGIKTTVVHIGSCDGDILQGRYFEGSPVARVARCFEDPQIIRGLGIKAVVGGAGRYIDEGFSRMATQAGCTSLARREE